MHFCAVMDLVIDKRVCKEMINLLKKMLYENVNIFRETSILLLEITQTMRLRGHFTNIRLFLSRLCDYLQHDTLHVDISRFLL
jgi:hypothetical protein